ncbi:MAG: hypothetical protein AAF525_13505 [Pseudomonadota bacterium]
MSYSGGAEYPAVTAGSGGPRRVRVPSKNATYSFVVDNVTYESRFTGMGFASWTLWPFGDMQWEIDAASDREVSVYYIGFLPQVSVLHRGLDILGIIILLMAGVTLIRFSKWLDSHTHA